MDTSKLKKFAQAARKDLLEQVGSKLAFVLKPESSARREYPAVVNELEKAISAQGKAALIDQVAYTWFNRFCALRFMDVNGYNRVGVVSPAEGQVQPEILAEAKSGVIDDTQINTRMADQIRGLLNGSISSPDAQTEAYRLLIVGSCNALYDRMPYMFERIQDFTELLMPDDLLSENSILANMRQVMTPESCQDVEIIGWLYQFYISEKKDQVFAGLKQNQKITAENIPAATQLFTPHWIVRYLVENSLGRLWMLNRPNSKLTEQMEYYIAPEEPETDFLKITSPEEIRICDPAAGSGHMLTYAFDLLYAIYEEEGYDAAEIPGLILTHNLTGVEIDDRAGALAAFALEMKAAAKLGRRRFLKMDAKPDICVLENVSFSESEMDDVMAIVGKDLYTADLRETLTQFEQAKNFGSLIVPKLKDPAETARLVEAKDFSGDLLLKDAHGRLVKVLRMAEYLSPEYHVVVANPPYKKKGDLNTQLQSFLVRKYPACFSDLYAAFIDRLSRLCCTKGLFAMIAMDSWLFGDDYTEMRIRLLSLCPFQQLAHLGPRAFDEIKGEVVQVASFVSQRQGDPDRAAQFFDLTEGHNSSEKASMLCEGHGKFLARTSDFTSLPRNVVAYFVSEHTRQAYSEGTPLKEFAEAFTGLQTGDNPRFIRSWSEVSHDAIDFNVQPESKSHWIGKWVPYVKGSDFRKWYGNHDYILDWSFDGAAIKAHKSATVRNEQYYFRSGLAYNTIASRLSVRKVAHGHIFDQKNSMFFGDSPQALDFSLGFLHSKVVPPLLRVVAAKDFGPGSMKLLPVFDDYEGVSVSHLIDELVNIAKSDWDAYETSWDFTTLPLLSPNYHGEKLEDSYARLHTHWQGMTDEMQQLEEENNSIFSDAYGLQDELTPEVPIEEITLTCNPAYRYGVKSSDEDRKTRLRSDTMAEFLSYAVGCMFGRYSLDEPGLILANQGERLEDYLSRVPSPSFMPDDDNVIPMIDFEGDWFEDDITERFKQFLRVTFGDEHYSENLAFIENALGKSVQKYFTKDFCNDHVKRYKKRPIYWLFSSPKGTFNALIYMHRYRPDTVSVVLNEYLREFRTKLEARKDSYEQISISASSSQKEKTQALKMIDKLDKAIDEVNGYERDVLYPLAGQNIEIDLDDGVKRNYPLFGSALKTITGLS